jgi:Tol biopolymer transport system component
VYEEGPGKFTAYDFQGKALGFTVDAGSLDVWRLPDESQVVNDAIYYRSADKTVVRAAAQGSRKLEGIPAENLSAFKVSPDEKLIAWTSNQWDQTPARSNLWVANLDGSQARQVMTATLDASSELLVPLPYRWTDDGQLLIVEVPTGIGGYILYRAYSTLHLYDPPTGEIKPLYRPETSLRMCLSGVTPDLTRIAFGCDDSGAGAVSVLTVADGQTTIVPDLPEQNVAGSARFSPSGGWLAYRSRGAIPTTSGQMAVVPADASNTPRIIAHRRAESMT